jgi:hypothetical protein
MRDSKPQIVNRQISKSANQQIANRKSRLVLLAGALLVLGAVAWGIGWAAHSLFDRWAAPPTTIVEPTVLPPATPTNIFPTVPVEPSLAPPAARPTSTLPPTSTPVPTSTASPTPQIRIYEVPYGQGLAKIAGIVCPALVTYQAREDFARQIQQWNPDKVQNIDHVPAGVELVIPPCP